jgi:hypothetical protein
MTIDASGNLLVAQTTSSGIGGTPPDVNGSELSKGYLNLNRDDLAHATQIQFGKNGAVAGRIHTDDRLSIGTGSTGIYFYNTGNSVLPFDNSAATPATRDNAIDLGSTGSRFKDLYLSEGINLSADDAGGVGSNTIGFKHTGHTAGYSAAIEASYGGDFRADLIFKINTSQANIAPVEVARFSKSGNLLVGTTSASPSNTNSFLYNVSGKAAVLNHASGTSSGQQFLGLAYNGGYIGSIAQSGTTAVLYNTSSDQRLKDNIVDAPSASDDIDAIQVRSFDWKVDGSHQKYGMVAQELQTVAPEAVSAPEDPEEMMGVDYSKLVPMMLKEIQSLRARVAQLES